MFKSVHNLGPSYLNDIFVLRKSYYETRSGNEQLVLNHPKTDSGKIRFLFQGGKLWNTLVTHIPFECSLRVFRKQLNNLTTLFTLLKDL